MEKRFGDHWPSLRVAVPSPFPPLKKNSRKPYLFEGNDVSISLPIGYEKSLIYQAAPVIDHLSLEESGHYAAR